MYQDYVQESGHSRSDMHACSSVAKVLSWEVAIGDLEQHHDRSGISDSNAQSIKKLHEVQSLI